MLTPGSSRLVVAIAAVLASCSMREHQIGMAGADGATTSSGGSATAGTSNMESAGRDSAGGAASTDMAMGADAGGEAPGGGETDGGAAGASGAGSGGGPSGCILLVDSARGNDDNEGRSWASALASLGAALERAGSGCEVWLTSGTYLPGSARQSTFSLPDQVTLRGGFTGTESAPGDRATQSEPTILSGDLGTALDPGDNSYHVVSTRGAATLERITVSGGNADQAGTDDDSGGGILAKGPLQLVDVTVSGNQAVADGGGVFAPLELAVSGSVFEHNTAQGNGGAISAKAKFELTIHDSRFDDNRANGGGAVSASAPSVEVVGSSFTASRAADRGGALYTDETSTLLVGGSTFDSNQGGDGGAIFALGPLSLTSSSVLSTQGSTGPAVVSLSRLFAADCEFSDNQGAIAVMDRGRSCSAIVKNSSFSGNNAATFAGGIYASSCHLTVSGSSFTSNSGLTGGAIDFEAFTTPGFWLTVEDSVFTGNTSQGGGAAIYNWGGDEVLTGDRFEGNSGGSAVYAWESPSVAVSKSRFIGNEGSEDIAGALTLSDASGSITDSEFAWNQSPRTGAILLFGGPLYLTNVTVAGNVGDTYHVLSSAGGGLESYGPVTIQNSIFWGNQPSDISASEYTTGEPPGPTIITSNFTDNDPKRPYDPRFVDPEADLRLRSDSPCVDAADDYQASNEDVLGQPRVDIAGVPSCPADSATCGGVADLGAHEYTPSP